MSKSIYVLLVPDTRTADLTKAGVVICSYYNADGDLVRGIGVEYGDEYPELPMVQVQVPDPQI
jgi:hypothetical protein